MSLASKLPWNHRFAGGFPGLSSQPLPTDADAIDYLTRMATADGAGVEVGVATAVDAFFRDSKAAGVFDALKACCILAGARTLAGALVPVVGDAPTNVANGFVEGDYSRTAGLAGDGTSYLDSGRADNADPQNDKHLAVYATASASGLTSLAGAIGSGAANGTQLAYSETEFFVRCNQATGTATGVAILTGLHGVSRGSSSAINWRSGGFAGSDSVASTASEEINIYVFARNYLSQQWTDATLAFYSIGTSLSLEDLDTAVTNLITAIGEAL